MNERALELLELPAILDRLANAAASEPGRRLAGAVRPASDPDDVERRQRLTSEAIAVLDVAAEPDLRNLHDIGADAELAGRGGTLEPASLRRICDTTRAGLAARATLDGGDWPTLAELVSTIDPGLGTIADAIARAIEEDGSDVRDDASPALAPTPARAARR